MDTETTTPAKWTYKKEVVQVLDSSMDTFNVYCDGKYWHYFHYEHMAKQVCDSGNAVNSHDSNVKRIAELEALIARINAATVNADEGRSGCKYGDTEYDSLSVAYGYNQLREEIQLLLSTLSSK